jgi:hypothetical protein
MIGEVIQFAAQDPQEAAATIKNTAASAGRIAGHALGMTADEIRTVTTRGVPAPVVAVIFFGVGALITMRYAPDSWITKVKRFGR